VLKSAKKSSKKPDLQKAIANPSFLKRVFSIPEDEMGTLHQLEKKLSINLDEFLLESKVAGEISLSKLSEIFSDFNLPEEPCFVSDQINYILNNVVPHSVHTASPKFIGHMTSCIPYFLISLTKCMVALHQNVVKIETSRSFTFLERQTLAMLHKLVYNNNNKFYKQHIQSRESTLGIQCSGGTVANITAMWIARNKFIESVLGKNCDNNSLVDALLTSGYRNCCILVSVRGHYSLKKASDLLGFGKKGFMQIKVNRDHSINLKDLDKVYNECLAQKIKPIALIGIAGTTETGSVDPLEKLHEFCQDKKVYFHVDAAWGGATLFSKKHSNKLKGIEHADSVVIDGHKQLYLPMGVGMLLFKQANTAKAIEHQTQYIIRSTSLDLGKRSLEGSRPGMALLAQSALSILGRKGYELLVNKNIQLAYTFSKLIRTHRHFELVSKPQLNILTYRFVPYLQDYPDNALATESLSKLNVKLQKEQRENGVSFVSRTTFRHPEPNGDSISILRAVIANPRTTEQDLADILEEQSIIGFKIIRSSVKSYNKLKLK
jgi:aspartate 1-decarboxylase